MAKTFRLKDVSVVSNKKLYFLVGKAHLRLINKKDLEHAGGIISGVHAVLPMSPRGHRANRCQLAVWMEAGAQDPTPFLQRLKTANGSNWQTQHCERHTSSPLHVI